jgi:hypothetical protein
MSEIRKVDENHDIKNVKSLDQSQKESEKMVVISEFLKEKTKIRVVIDINEERDKRDEKSDGQKDDDDDNTDFDTSKHFLIVSSRDIEAEEINLLRSYGTVLVYDDCHVNIPLDDIIREYQPHYFLFDVRQKNHRIVLTRDFRKNFHILALIAWYELLEDFIDDINAVKVIKNFPEREATREIFDRTLLCKKIREPSLLKSIFQCIRNSKQAYRAICSKLRGCICQQFLICAGAPPPVVYAANLII